MKFVGASLREAPLKFTRGHLGIARKGGGLDPCPDGLGHFFREEFAKIKWAFAWFWGGLNPCQDGLGHLCSENGSSKAKRAMPKCPRVNLSGASLSGAIWWPYLQLMQVAPSCGQFVTNVIGAMLLPKSIPVTESISGSVVPLAMFHNYVAHL